MVLIGKDAGYIYRRRPLKIKCQLRSKALPRGLRSLWGIAKATTRARTTLAVEVIFYAPRDGNWSRVAGPRVAHSDAWPHPGRDKSGPYGPPQGSDGRPGVDDVRKCMRAGTFIRLLAE